MSEKEIKISYTEYGSMDELEREDRELAQSAIQAMNSSYSPYSHFRVGAAVKLSDGVIVTGANQENAAFPSGLCAERTALFAAGAQYPEKDIVGIAIAGGLNGIISETPATPCGSCRQVMAQFQTKSGKPMSILMIGARKIWKFKRVDDILPFIFDSI